MNKRQHDLNGSLLAKSDAADQPIIQFDYDQRRLVNSIDVNGQSDNSQITYDPNGYRIQKQVGTDVSNYYLEAEHLESVYNENDEIKAHYLRGAVVDELVNGFEKNTAGELENVTYHHDQVNSITAITDHNGEILKRTEYGSFGEHLETTGTNAIDLSFTGREYDTESGLYYNRARYYDPEIGRFISEDPIGFEGGINYYAYVGNNPMASNDPSGLNAISMLIGILGDMSKIIGDTQCKECADAMIEAAQDLGLSGKRIDVRAPGSRNIYSDSQGKNISTNGDHSAIEIDGLVYDNYNPKGISRAQFEADLLTPNNNLKFNTTSFDGGDSYKGALSSALGLVSAAGTAVITVVSEEVKAIVRDPVEAAYQWTIGDFISNTGGCSRSGCSDQLNMANGGFLIYPNKINSSQNTSVYQK